MHATYIKIIHNIHGMIIVQTVENRTGIVKLLDAYFLASKSDVPNTSQGFFRILHKWGKCGSKFMNRKLIGWYRNQSL